MKLKLQTCAAIVIIAIMLAAPAAARADAVGDWNAIAVQATITAGRANPTIGLDIATVQAAVYDAVQAIEKRYEPYYVEIPGATGSPVAATAKAAHDVAWLRPTLASRWAQEPLPGSSPCERVTGVSLTPRRRPSSAAPPPASGAQRSRHSPRWWRLGWTMSLPSP